TVPCDRCQQPAARFSTAERVAIDLDLDHPILLLITVSVHCCAPCRHYFRAQPPFLRPDASSTNRVVATAVAAVYQDGMSMRRGLNSFSSSCAPLAFSPTKSSPTARRSTRPC